MKKLVLFLSLAVMLSGCLTTMPGKSADELKPIAIGMSMEQVRKNFGPPDEVPGAGESGQHWEYHFYEGTAHVHFNEYGEVEQINDLPGEYIKSSY